MSANGLLPCPFCGATPDVEPFNWKQSGDAWGRVVCRNPKCDAASSVEVHSDDECASGEENSKRCKLAAISRWNHRAQLAAMAVEVPQIDDNAVVLGFALAADGDLDIARIEINKWFRENARPAPATVTVPREEWEAYQKWEKTVRGVAFGMSRENECLATLDALRSAPPATNQKEKHDG